MIAAARRFTMPPQGRRLIIGLDAAPASTCPHLALRRPAPFPSQVVLMDVGRFLKLPVALASRSDIGGSAKVVGAYLCNRQGDNGSAWPSERRIASDLGMSRNGVRSAIKELSDAGVVRVRSPGAHAGRKRTTHYEWYLERTIPTKNGTQQGPFNGTQQVPELDPVSRASAVKKNHSPTPSRNGHPQTPAPPSGESISDHFDSDCAGAADQSGAIERGRIKALAWLVGLDRLAEFNRLGLRYRTQVLLAKVADVSFRGIIAGMCARHPDRYAQVLDVACEIGAEPGRISNPGGYLRTALTGKGWKL